ncbi:MAG TPA: cytochrome-c peroxidase, partial [Verrucomicrobiae bacterium]|nr:cytochrome-c peroxidase [Verrucomicrobiae bacterium]
MAGFLAGNALADPDIAALRARANAEFGPLPAQMPGAEHDTPALVKLGRKLYFDKRLSTNKTISCSSCHDLDSGGAYGRTPAHTAPVKHSDRDSPTVLNAGFQLAQFWD